MAFCPDWTPLPGQKRKAFAARLDEDKLATDVRPSPKKLWACDDEVADVVLDATNKYDPANNAQAFQGDEVPMDEDEGSMAIDDIASGASETAPAFGRSIQPGDDTIDKSGVSQTPDLDGKESEHSVHASQPKSSTCCKHNYESLTKKDVTLVLSTEIQESLSLKRLNDDFLLPKLMASRPTPSNSMVLVEWKPKPTNPLDYFLKRTGVGESSTKLHNKLSQPTFPSPNNIPSVQQTSTEASSFVSLLPLQSRISSFTDVQNDEDEGKLDIDSESSMDIDTL